LREIIGFFQSGISRPDNGRCIAPDESAVADGAIGDTPTDIFFLTGDV